MFCQFIDKLYGVLLQGINAQGIVTQGIVAQGIVERHRRKASLQALLQEASSHKASSKDIIKKGFF